MRTAGNSQTLHVLGVSEVNGIENFYYVPYTSFYSRHMTTQSATGEKGSLLMASPSCHDYLLLSGSDDFLYRIMQDHKPLIKHIANRFRHLDSMYDTEDLEQEAFFGVRSACNAWAHARAINMQFKTYLTWHISRHFQGRFHGEDKVVDILDQDGQVRVSIPWSKYRKTGRAAAKARGFSTRIRSLLVYYEDQSHSLDRESKSVTTDWHPIHSDGDDTIVDILDPDGALIVTVPRQAYVQLQDLVQEQGYTVIEYSIYDIRPGSAPHTSSHGTPPSSPADVPSNLAHTPKYVVDVYTRQNTFLTRIPITRYYRYRRYFQQFRLTARIHDREQVPEPLYIDEGVPAHEHNTNALLTSSAT